MKKVLLSLLSVVALSAATEIESPIDVNDEGRIKRKECPPGPTKNHPVVEWCKETNQWLRYNRNTGQWDEMPAKSE